MSRDLTSPDDPVEIPESLAAAAARWNRAAGRRWMDRPPGLVAKLAGEWALELGSPYFAVWAYELGEDEPVGRLTRPRSLTQLAGS